MKKVLFVIMLLTLLMTGFTWEGELDPNTFSEWERLKVSPAEPGSWWLFVRNPDITSPIDLVALGVADDGTLLVYQYFKLSEPFVYDYDAQQDRFVRRRLTYRERYRCIACHIGEEV